VAEQKQAQEQSDKRQAAQEELDRSAELQKLHLQTINILSKDLADLRKQLQSKSVDFDKKMQEVADTQKLLDQELARAGQLQQVLQRCTQNMDLVATRRFKPTERLLVVDTNWIIKMSNLILIPELRDIQTVGELMPKGMYLFIPYCVVIELNRIQNDSTRPEYMRSTIRTFRNFLVSQVPDWIVVQTVAAIGPKLRKRCDREPVADNKIVFIYQALMQCPMRIPILLSDDRFLNVNVRFLVIAEMQGITIFNLKVDEILTRLHDPKLH
jgi:hypothetical protein